VVLPARPANENRLVLPIGTHISVDRVRRGGVVLGIGLALNYNADIEIPLLAFVLLVSG
jgi:hypothetical protein